MTHRDIIGECRSVRQRLAQGEEVPQTEIIDALWHAENRLAEFGLLMPLVRKQKDWLKEKLQKIGGMADVGKSVERIRQPR